MDAIIVTGMPEEIAALVLAVQERRMDSSQVDDANSRAALIHEYERRLANLKNGISPRDVIF